MDAAISLLDRRLAALAGQESAVDFLVSVEPFLRALEGEPRIARDLRDETLDRVRVLEHVDGELAPELIKLRKTLARLCSDLDDGDASPPDAGGDKRDWVESLAHFDVIAASDPPLLTTRATARVRSGCSTSSRASGKLWDRNRPANVRPG